MRSIGERVRALDLSLFGYVLSQAYPADRASLLGLHGACRRRYGRFTYLEIGSYLGGSLQALVADPDCTAIVSIDARPGQSPDDSRGHYTYHSNSTAHMLELLSSVPGADLSKVTPIDSDVSRVTSESLPEPPQLCFIDGEHTRSAVLKDACFCARVTDGQACIVFHDRDIVRRGIGDFLEYLQARDVDYVGYPLPQTIFVVEIGSAPLLPLLPPVRRGRRAERAVWTTASKLPSRGRALRFLLWVWEAALASQVAARRGARRGRKMNKAVRRRGRRFARSARRGRRSARRARKLLRTRRKAIQVRLGAWLGTDPRS